MRRLMLLAAALLAAAPAAAAERRYSVTDFDRVHVQGPFSVTLVTGRASTAVARAANLRALDRVSIEVLGRQLRIRTRDSWGGYPGAEETGGVEIELTTRDLGGVFVRGPGTLAVDRARAMRFDVSLSGSGKIAIGDVQADVMTITQVGSGSVVLAGRAKSVRAAVQGSGDLDASALQTRDVVVNAGTDGYTAVAASNTARVNSDGAGDVEIIGDPACTVEVRGTGRVKCGGR